MCDETDGTDTGIGTFRLAGIVARSGDYDIVAAPRPDPFKRVPEIAARLGVEALRPDSPHPGFQIALQDGQRYDVFELLAALLDRMDEVHTGFGPREAR